jgi:hypothetical protein
MLTIGKPSGTIGNQLQAPTLRASPLSIPKLNPKTDTSIIKNTERARITKKVQISTLYG